MNFNTTEVAKLSQEILEHVPENKKEALLGELRAFDDELSGLRKELRECRKNELMIDILPVIFHKMKNKLTPIMGYSQILQTRIDDERQKDRVKKIETNADILTLQFNLIRDFYAGKKSAKEKENLNDILSGLKPYFSDIRKNTELDIALDPDPHIPEDRLFPGEIEMLITNLVDNAVQAIKVKKTGKGLIVIRTKAGEDVYSLSIRDNGCGISPKNVAKIWTPFFSEFEDRAGLGLTLCEKIIANHEATFTVDSLPGEFSEFTILFKSGRHPQPMRETKAYEHEE